MIKNIKKSIMFGAIMMAFLGISGVAFANMTTSNYPITESYMYSNSMYYGGTGNSYYDQYYSSRLQNNYASQDTNGYYNQNQNYLGYNNGYNNTPNTNYGYTGSNTNLGNQEKVVYGSDQAPKENVVSNTSTVKNTAVSKTSTVTNTKTIANTNTQMSSKDVSTDDAVIVSGDDRTVRENKNNIVALSAYGTGQFLPDTILEWIMIFFLMLIIVILFRLITKKRHYKEINHA